MPTFIDESGDTSHHVDGKWYFRLAAVWIPANQTAPLREAFARIRRAERLDAAYEFKYSKTHLRPQRRRAFYEACLSHDMRFVAAAIDKRSPVWCRAERQELFHTTAGCLTRWLAPIYYEAERGLNKPLREPVVVDCNDDAMYLSYLQNAFREIPSTVNPKAGMAQKPKFDDSRTAELLQVADMVIGAVGDMLNGEDSQWYASIARAGIGEGCGRGQGVNCWP